MEMGTGKTKVAIDTMAILYEAEKLKAVLIIAPKGVYDNWVKGEIPIHLPKRIPRQLCRWIPSKTKKFEEELMDFIVKKDPILKIFVMNVEAFSTPRGTEAATAFLYQNPANMVVVDESTTIKNRKAARTKNIMSLQRHSKYRRILTGSPITKSPMDLFSQCGFLAEKSLGFNSFYAFQGRYANIQQRTMGHRSFQQVMGYRRLDELSEKLDVFSNRVLKMDCLDLPPKVYIRRDVELTPEQEKLYRQMKKLALAKLDNGELATTASVLTQIMRLQQICCGHLMPDDGAMQLIKNNRLTELLNLVEEVQGKAIIWATYTHDILQISKELSERFGPESVATYYGDTEQDARQEIVNDFQDVENPLRFFVGQPRTGGYGITLTAANTVIYYSNSYDLEIRLQSEDRAHRIGQTNKVTYIDLVSPNTIDEKILQALRSKIDIAGQVLKEDTKSWLR
jgi:SNF2 family DNA or RNA helicase|tara:strand:- start:817 stop:2175 length:1359 start_codon:yes stop_codon:yes gene_type:complete